MTIARIEPRLPRHDRSPSARLPDPRRVGGRRPDLLTRWRERAAPESPAV